MIKGRRLYNSFLFVSALMLLVSGCAAMHQHRNSLEVVEDRWGIEIMGIRLTSAGYMLDFRYKVIDPAKAAPIFNRNLRPLLIHHATGATLTVPNPPKVGPLRTSNKPIKGRIYFMFFGNPGKIVKRGDLVTIKVGRFHIKNIAVE